MSNYFVRVWWSVPFDPEDISTTGGGYIDLYNGGGAITGMTTIGSYLLVFQERCYTVYQYVVGDVPISFVKEVGQGCRHQRTIQKVFKNGVEYVMYLSSNNELRMTSGGGYDLEVSTKIRPFLKAISDTNTDTIHDYYTSGGCTRVPSALYDSVNAVYRLYYSDGSESINNKVLNYFVEKNMFSTGTANVNATCSISGRTPYLGVLGTANSDGKTLVYLPNASNTSLTGTVDFGWMTSSEPAKRIKVNGMYLWLHAQGSGSATDCDATLTFTGYNDPSVNTAVVTVAKTLTYNSSQSNLQWIYVPIGLVGDYVRVSMTDSGTTNYSIDKVVIDYEELDLSPTIR